MKPAPLIDFHHIRIGTPGKPCVVFGHGWGRTHRDFIPVAEALAPSIDGYLFDFPGFGQSPRPSEPWGTAKYAEAMARHLLDQCGIQQCTFVGHSFGGRVGLRLGARAPGLVRRLVIVAGAGVPRVLPWQERLRRKQRSMRFQRLKAKATTPEALLALEQQYGSADYVASREAGMRDIFVATIAEDQTDQLGRISVPTALIYGALDTETPPQIGRSIAAGISGAEYIECPFLDHLSILDRGRHQIALAIKEGLGEHAA
ncbi:alpha/beta fold hydrolase [Croceicoccus sp. F390]|uniref:Alpha/beta fold hydrolase n=1 Tax=Croceicoccus esteveae TaxID=3075597 RepID=A0ABU2ZFJ4_9SPHN|nr:alpha/beta fold hydrolase [Croceicoccus sp. F390]MDT0574986.1 alpha/beta fold hydrolase [Croceicoccus sp. F390]